MNLCKRLLALTMSLALEAPVPAAVPAAPWPAPMRSQLEKREYAIWPGESREASSAKGVVSATASPIAVHAGAEVLRAGGTAADAAVATAFAQITTMLGANVSFAGVAQLVYFEAKTGKVFAMDAGWNGWRNEKSPGSIPATDLSAITGTQVDTSGAAGRKTLVPGFMAGMAAMHGRFGRLPFARLLAPSIWYARSGVPVTPLLAAYFPMAERYLDRTAGGRAFLRPDGLRIAGLGDRHASPDLARLLERVAERGVSEMYRGRWAKDFVAAVNGAGGNATIADLAAYRVRWSAPARTRFGGMDVYAPGEANKAGCGMLAALNVLDHLPAKTPYWQDPHAFRATALALRSAWILAWSRETAALVTRRIGTGADCASMRRPAFGTAAAGQLEMLLDGSSPVPPGHHSASVVAIDRWGNVAALVHSSNTPLWGDTGMVVDGVPIPAPAGLYKDSLMHIPAGSRIASDMSPLIALRSGKPAFAVATIGSSELQEAVRIMAGLIRRSAEPGALLAAPPLLLNFEQLTGPALARDEFVPTGRYPARFLDEVRATGMNVKEVDAAKALVLRGTAALAGIRADGLRFGVEAPQVLEFMEAE